MRCIVKRALFIIFIGNNIVFAQHGISINGFIVDVEERPIADATIALIDSTSNSLIKTFSSDSLGRFEINLPTKSNLLYVKVIGYLFQKVAFSSAQPIVRIKLEPDPSFVLHELIVSSQRHAVKIKTDRLEYNMTNNLLKNDNTLEVLKFVPLVVVNGESFSIVGKDYTELYINGRKTHLNQVALISYLKTLPAENIKTIEVITTPNSTYRGEGNFGILNIQLKDNENEGLNGVFSGQLWKTHYFKERGNLNLNYQKKKFVSSFSVGITDASDWKENSVESLYKNNYLSTLTSSTTKGDNQGYFANLVADCNLNDNETIGFVINASLDNGNWAEMGSSNFSKALSGHIDSLISIDHHSNANGYEVALNANYRISFDNSKKHFFTDFDFLNNYQQQKSLNIMNYLNDDGSYLSLYKNFKQKAPQNSNVWSVKVEYGNSPDSTLNLKTGFDSYYSIIDNNDRYDVWKDIDYQKDTLRSNHFALEEWTSAVFLFGEKKWSKKITTSLGARLEYTKYKGIQHTLGSDFENDYFKLLPTFYLNYSPSRNHNFSYDFSCRISRPSFGALNPFRVYSSPTTYSTGNPFLKPSNRFSQSLKYLMFGKYYLQASYNFTFDKINGVQIVKENSLIESTLLNIDKYKEFNVQFNMINSYLDEKVTIDLTIAYNWLYLKGNEEASSLGYTNQYLSVDLNGYFSLSKKHKISFDFGGGFYTKQKYSNREYPSSVDFSAQLKKQYNNWQFSLYCYMSFYLYNDEWTQRWRLIYDTEDLQIISYKKGEPTSIGLRFSYSFGNKKISGAKKRETSNTEVKSRVK